MPFQDSRPLVVPVHEEPMHHLVHDEGNLRVLDVQIPPGATTQYHTHDAAIAYVPIDTSPSDNQVLGGEWEGTESTDPPRFSIGIVTWNLGYASTPLTHRVKNVGAGPFRLIAIVSYGRGATTDDATSVLAGRPDRECQWFRTRHVVLRPGTRIEDRTGTTRIAIVQVSCGSVKVTGDTVGRLDTPGAFVVVGAGSGYSLENATAQPVTLVGVAVRALESA